MTNSKLLSHIATLGIGGLITLTSSHAKAEDYLMQFIVNDENKGEYLISTSDTSIASDENSRNEKALAEKSLWTTIGVNAVRSLPLSRLEGLGRVTVVWSKQIIYFYPNEISKIDYSLKPEAIIRPAVNFIDVKSADYSLTYSKNQNNRVSGSITTTGRVGKLDFDLHTGFGGQQSYLASNIYSEDSPYIKRMEFGRLQRENLNGVYFTNESELSPDTFAKDRIALYWPKGTRVDVYRDDKYIESVVIDKEPFDYTINLNYSNNLYRFNAVLPNGEVKTRKIIRSIGSRLTPVGRFNYRLALGQEVNSRIKKVIGEIGYGLTQNLSLFTKFANRNTDNNYISALYSRKHFSFEVIGYKNRNHRLNAMWDNDNFSIYSSFEKIKNGRNNSITLSYRKLFSPSLTYSYNTKTGGEKNNKWTLRTFHNLYLNRINTYIAFSPEYSKQEFKHKNIKTRETDSIGGRLFITFPHSIQTIFSYYRESEKSHNLSTPTTSVTYNRDWEISKRFSIGNITYRNEQTKNTGKGWTTDNQSLTFNLWNWDQASLSLTASRSSDHKNTFSASISGSFDRSGFNRFSQASQASLEVTTCRDKNYDGICQNDEPEVIGIEVKVSDGWKTAKTPALINSLTPYRKVTVELSGDFGLNPRYKMIKTERLIRGGINRIRLPLAEIREIEGKLDHDDIEVALVDIETGKIINTQLTHFGGWYLFYAPSYQKVKAVPVKDLNNQVR